MSKRRKTRQQKIIAEFRRQVSPSVKSEKPIATLSQATFSLPTMQPVKPVAVQTASTAYLKYDIAKTGVLTLAIIAAQLVLFFLLKHHTLVVPNLAY